MVEPPRVTLTLLEHYGCGRDHSVSHAGITVKPDDVRSGFCPTLSRNLGLCDQMKLASPSRGSTSRSEARPALILLAFCIFTPADSVTSPACDAMEIPPRQRVKSILPKLDGREFVRRQRAR